MGIEIPGAVQWLTPIVVGASWPEGDETRLRAMRDAWEAAAKSVGEVLSDGNGASAAALGCMSGQTAEKFEEYWKKYTEGDAYLVNLQQICTDLAAGCDSAALGIEYTKLSIIAALIILAAQIAAMIASAVATFGASTAGIPIAQAATRITVQVIFQQLIKQIIINLAINVGVDVAIQTGQLVFGDRKSWDFGKTVDAGIAGIASGIAGGAVGIGSSALGNTTGNFVQAAGRGAVEGAIAGAGGNVLNNLAHGKVEAKDFGSAILSGGVSGSVGGAVGGMGNRHEGLSQTWGTGTSPDGQYTAGANTQGHTFTTPDGATTRANVDGNPYQGGWGSDRASRIPGDGGPNNVNDPTDSDYQVKSSANPPRMVGRLDLPDPPPQR
ncbi:hypothetical protein SAMN05216188_10280 [Lentzea xinjiangensis]|uniref:Outer membrane channel protein CpnT-like N-terminal domain-containing protein n=1 Tax=Lentzea xinjiangensis TaxID=402600 RepID=A0A1H9DB28_9PSEU|nr:hypothetical protein [Lentzea xinjiangensis]SEQ10527.1 hypothetical protein SAMN05216188_10280 [Lentzea xinjiangensis]